MEQAQNFLTSGELNINIMSNLKQKCKTFSKECYNHSDCMRTLEDNNTPNQIIEEGLKEFDKTFGLVFSLEKHGELSL